MLKALTGIVAAIFKRGAKERQLPKAAMSPGTTPECDDQLGRPKGLYGSWGPCELCKKPLAGDSWVPRPSRNYLVTQTAPGKFCCEVMIQDGWERWDEPSLEIAKESIVRAAKFLNGTTLDEGNISVKMMGGR